MDETCGTAESAAARFVNEVAYGAWQDPTPPARGTVHVQLDRHEVFGLPDGLVWNLAPGEASLYLLAETYLLEGDDWRESVVVAAVDPGTGETRMFDGPNDDDLTRRVLASDDGPVLVEQGDGMASWRFDPVSGAWTALPIAGIASDTPIDGGAVLGVTAWLLVRPDGERAFVRINLATRSKETLDWPAEVGAWWFTPGLDGRLDGIGWSEGGTRLAVTFDTETGGWSVAPSATHGLWLSTLVDGRQLTTWEAPNRSWEAVGDLVGLAVVDPTTGEWWMGDDACDGGIGRSSDVAVVGGAPILWEWGNSWSPDDPLYGSGVLVSFVSVGPTE